MKNNNYRCLLLNADYSPLSIIDWKKALTWYMKYEHNPKFSIDIIDFYKNDYIQGTHKTYAIPSVARTNRFFNVHKSLVVFSRKNIFLRDDNTCQYCGIKFDTNSLYRPSY